MDQAIGMLLEFAPGNVNSKPLPHREKKEQERVKERAVLADRGGGGGGQF
jgi:hypothetical protein